MAKISDLPTTDVMVDRLHAIYDGTSKHERISGMTWYASALEHASLLHLDYGYSVETIVNLIAVVSPGADWDLVNIGLPERMLIWHAQGRNLSDMDTNIYPSNILKAQRILDGHTDVLKGNKVTRFARNIMGEYHPATVDGWGVRMVLARPDLAWKQTAVSSDGCYRLIEDAFQIAAYERGIPTAMFQAVVWVAYRNVHYRKSASYRRAAA